MNMAEKIKYLRKKHGMTQEELGKALGVGKSAVYKYEHGNVQNLKRSSIQRIAEIFNVSPSYLFDDDNLIRRENKSVKIPVLGYVRAGVPIEAVEEILDYEEISTEMARHGEFFALKVKGDSMEPRIVEGDVVIVRQQETVDNGSLAVVLVNGNDATVKKFYRTEQGIKLISINSKYDPLFYTPEEVDYLPVAVIGKVVELRGKF